MGTAFVVSKVWADGGAGGKDLAERVVEILDNKPSDFKFLYDLDLPIEAKIEAICTKIYGADGIKLSSKAKANINRINKMGFSNLPVCMAKTQYSFSDNPDLLGAPTGFEVNISEVKVSAGAGFLVVLTGEIMTMPGLPKVPSAEKIDIDENGNISGLF